jgi:hypothetical protein
MADPDRLRPLVRVNRLIEPRRDVTDIEERRFDSGRNFIRFPEGDRKPGLVCGVQHAVAIQPCVAVLPEFRADRLQRRIGIDAPGRLSQCRSGFR